MSLTSGVPKSMALFGLGMRSRAFSSGIPPAAPSFSASVVGLTGGVERRKAITPRWYIAADKAGHMKSLMHAKTEEPVVLYGTTPCPFVERVEMALKHAAVKYESKAFDLGSLKDRDALRKLSPYGRVPILEHGRNKHIFESMSICQYIDDAFIQDERRRLMRGTPYEKALTRSWTHFVNQKIAGQMWQTLLSMTDDTLERNYDELISSLEALDTALREISGGPFFLGTDISYLDIMIAPFLHRRLLISHFKDREMFPAEATRLKQLCEALEEVPFYRSTASPAEDLIKAYKPYLSGHLHPKFGWH